MMLKVLMSILTITATKLHCICFCEICTTRQCKDTADLILNNMDPTKNPCHDFYAYACGNANSFVFQEVEKQVSLKISRIIRDEQKKDDILPVKLAKDMYRKCLKFRTTEKIVLINLLKYLGGWPVIDENWNDNLFKIDDYYSRFKKLGFGTDDFLTLIPKSASGSVTILVKEAGEFFKPSALEILSSRLNIKLETQIESEEIEEEEHYYHFLKLISIVLGVNPFRTKVQLRQVCDLAKTIKNLNEQSSVKSRNVKMWILSSVYTNIPWQQLAEAVLQTKIQGNVSSQLFSIQTSDNYIKEIDNILATTPKSLIANYVISRALLGLVQFFSGFIRNKLIRMDSNLYNIPTEIVKVIHCASVIDRYFPDVITFSYIKEYVNNDVKQSAEEMTYNIKEQLQLSLNRSKFFEPQTKHRAMVKVDNMKILVAYSKNMSDPNTLIRAYENFNYSYESYFANILKGSAFWMERMENKSSNPMDSNWPDKSITDVNAYNELIKNSVFVPVGLLSDHVFSVHRPQYFNYATLGYIVGHEMTHGFDQFGRMYDENGLRTNWWDPVSQKNYDDKSMCYVNQYRTFFHRYFESPRQTLSEDIADNGGMKLAIEAYQQYQQSNNESVPLELTQYTTTQLFWLSYANLYCAVDPSNYDSSDVHSDYISRVNLVLSNQPQFAEDFNCPVDSAMNPSKKCTIFD